MQTQKFKYILFSQQIIQKQGIITLAQQVTQQNHTNRSLPQNQNQIIIPRCLTKNQDYDLRFSILAQNINVRINFNQKSNDDGGEGDGKWVVCVSWEVCMLEILQGVVGVIIISQGQEEIDVKDMKYFVVRTIKQALNIVSMSNQQLQRRWKMQLMLKKSKTKYQINKKVNQLRNFVNNLVTFQLHKQVRKLTLSLNFYGRKRLRTLRKYFNQWTISHYQNLIQKRQQEIIQGNYLMQQSNRKLVQKCFNGWKKLREINLRNIHR